MSKFAAIDQAVIAAVRAGARQFNKIMEHGSVRAEAARLVDDPTANRGGTNSETRVLDRRLQAMRRAGHIAYVNNAWQLKKEPHQ